MGAGFFFICTEGSGEHRKSLTIQTCLLRKNCIKPQALSPHLCKPAQACITLSPAAPSDLMEEGSYVTIQNTFKVIQIS